LETLDAQWKKIEASGTVRRGNLPLGSRMGLGARILSNELGDMSQFNNERQLFSYTGLTREQSVVTTFEGATSRDRETAEFDGFCASCLAKSEQTKLERLYREDR